MGTQRSLFVLLLVLVLNACGDDAAPPPLELGNDASTEDARVEDAIDFDNPEPPNDANVDYDAEPFIPGAGPGGDGDDTTSTQDRCYDASCGRSALPVQEDLEFLEPMGDGWLRLMEADWELAPTAEGYRCMTFTIPEDVYITAFYPQSPQGTHHATFGVAESAEGPDRVYACGVGVSGTRRLQGSGAGTEPSELPDGVAQPLRKGQQITMNLHLFNVTDETLRGRSGVWVKAIPADQVVNESESILAGPLMLNIPVGESTQLGQCTLSADVTLYSVQPHMHQIGTHLRATAMTAAGEVPIHDGPYDFTHQVVHDIDPIELKSGDVVKIECTYQNDTSSPVMWGDSSLDEMCFIGLSVYPATGSSGGFPCSN
jgi:hypothetical protein